MIEVLCLKPESGWGVNVLQEVPIEVGCFGTFGINGMTIQLASHNVFFNYISNEKPRMTFMDWESGSKIELKSVRISL